MTRLDLMIHWEIAPIERLLNEVPEYLSQRAEEARRTGKAGFLPDGKLGDEEVYLAALSLTKEAIIYHLNALVDWVLLALATRILPQKWGLTRKAQSRSRGQLIKAIETQYHINLKLLSGWEHVDLLREEANALKHRGGASIIESSEIDVPVLHRVDTTIESLRARLGGIREWLMMLWKATEAAPNKAN